ncbi:hypothetical protein MMC29_007248 [Sticta canariensis]|nr:hypothetical protein [Sticta canariensis]
MADRIVLNETNAELYEANVREKNKETVQVNNYEAQGARHLSLEEIERRREYARSKQKELENKQTARKMKRGEAEIAKACKELMRLGPDLLGLPSKKNCASCTNPEAYTEKTQEKLVTTQRKKRKTTI